MNDSKYPVIVRTRHIPDEYIELKGDEILFYEGDLMITRWKTLKPREDFAGGTSAYVSDKGYKVTRVINKDGLFEHWYIDIIRTHKTIAKNTVIYEDLLLDVVIYEDGSYRILDLDELLDSYREKSVDETLFIEALSKLEVLLRDIYSGEIKKTMKLIEEYLDK